MDTAADKIAYQGYDAHNQGRFSVALPLLKKAVAMSERVAPGCTRCVLFAHLLRVLSDCYLRMEDFPAALSCAERALTIAGSLDGNSVEVKIMIADCSHSIGCIYLLLGREAEAIQACESALEIYEAIGVEVAGCDRLWGAQNLAGMLFHIGLRSRALACLRRAEQLGQSYDDPSFNLSVSRSQLELLAIMGYHRAALVKACVALAASERRFGSTSIQVAEIISHIYSLHTMKNRTLN